MYKMTHRGMGGKIGKALLDFNVFPLKPGGLCSRLKVTKGFICNREFNSKQVRPFNASIPEQFLHSMRGGGVGGSGCRRRAWQVTLAGSRKIKSKRLS